MKKLILGLFGLLSFSLSYGQGPLAHWNMDSTVNDVSGGGHHGHASNIVPALGRDGIMGHGYYFNGVNSMITVPYSPSFNVTNYSICATVNVMGFYSGPCQYNIIITRGKTGAGTGTYYLAFSDHSTDQDCSNFDSTEDGFLTIAGTNYTVGVSPDYTPHITSNTWYRVVGTYDGTTYKTYVNGVLKSSFSTSGSATPIGSSTDSISIGYNIFESGYSYPFKGVIDDILLYDRVLTDSEAVHYGDACGVVTTQPASVHTTVGSTCTFTTNSSITGAVYQWQQNTGSGFVNLTATAPYSGVTTNTLTITGVSAPLGLSQYRCLVSNSLGCSDTTRTDTLFLNTGINNNPITDDMVLVIPNPTYGNVSIQMPYYNGKGNIDLINPIGQLVYSEPIESNVTNFDLKSLASGIYIAIVHIDGQTMYRKIQKQ